MSAQGLTRAALAASGADARPAPVRMVHLGLGAFHRAHQAWYTQRAGDGWGIAAFTGRTPRAAGTLAAQDGLYTLVTRGPDGDRVEVMTALSEVHDGADLPRLRTLLADPAVGVVTLTITEAGYRTDTAASGPASGAASAAASGARGAEPTSALGRLVSGLAARRAADAGPIAIVSCDNIPANAEVTRRAVLALADEQDAAVAAWIERNVSFVGTSVDRITPAHDVAADGEIAAVVAAGWHDAAAVVTEPFADWVLQGDFPAGRPAWERAGARFVDDLAGWENRKLWLLNGAHTILVVTGLAAGHTTVAEAFADPDCRRAVEAFWAEAVTCLPPGVEHECYRRDLAARFANPRIAHRLGQIAAECTAKVRYRIAPVARMRHARGLRSPGCAAALGAWARIAPRLTAPDAEHAAVRAAASAPDPAAALAELIGVDPDDIPTPRV